MFPNSHDSAPTGSIGARLSKVLPQRVARLRKTLWSTIGGFQSQDVVKSSIPVPSLYLTAGAVQAHQRSLHGQGIRSQPKCVGAQQVERGLCVDLRFRLDRRPYQVVVFLVNASGAPGSHIGVVAQPSNPTAITAAPNEREFFCQRVSSSLLRYVRGPRHRGPRPVLSIATPAVSFAFGLPDCPLGFDSPRREPPKR